MRQTQKERILRVLREAKGEKVSGRVFKQDMKISESNGRISELRGEGHEITTEGEDEYGFAYHRLIEEPIRKIIRYERVEREGIPFMKPVYNF